MNLSIYTSEFKRSLQIAYPIIIGQLGHILVGFADNLMVGQLGSGQLAAISLANGFIFIFLSLGIGFSFAITTLTAEANGAKSDSKLKAVFKHGFVLTLISGIVISAVLYFVKPLLYIIDQPKEVVNLVDNYYNIVSFSMIPVMLFQGLKQFCDGLAFTKYAMKATIIGNIVNVFFNYILINGLLGFPKLGIDGAAYGTLISRFVMFGIMLYFMLERPQLKKFTTNINFLKLDNSVFLKIFKIGYPTALQMWFEVNLFVSGIFLSGILGKNPQAANQIALNLISITFMLVTGLGITATIRVAEQKALKAYTELRRIAISLFLLMTLITVGFTIIFLVFRNILPIFYVYKIDILDKTEVMEIASTLLIVAGFFQLSDGIQVVVLGALRGLQDVFVPMIITFISYWVIGFPCSYFLGIHTELKSTGIWLGLLLALVSSSLLLSLRFNYLSKKLIKQQSI